MISNDFINECKKETYANRLGQLVVDGLLEPMDENSNVQNFAIDDACYVNGDIIGSVYVRKLTSQLLDTNEISLIDKTIYAKIGVKYDDNSMEYINMGKYTVERPKDEKTANMSQIVAYSDLMNKIDKPYACGIDYEQENITLEDLYVDVCEQLELEPKTLQFTNNFIPIKANPFTNGETNRIVLQTICKISGTFIDIDVDNNMIDLKWLSQNEEPDYTFSQDDYSTLEGGEIVFGPVNCLIIKNSQIDSENVTIKDDESIELNGEHSIVISEDYILYDAELRQQAIQALWNKIHNLTYVDCKLTTYLGKPFLKIGDKIRIYTNDNDYFDTYVLKHNFTYDGTFTSIIESPALTQQEIATKQDITLGQTLRNTQSIVNKQEGKITQLVEETSENTNKIAQIETTIDTIEQQIAGEYGMTKEVSGTDFVHIDDALKYYPLELTIKGYSDLSGLRYPDSNMFPGLGIYPTGYQEPDLSTLTICVDSSLTPTENLKEYEIDFGEPLRSLGNVKDKFQFLIDEDGAIKGIVTRYLKRNMDNIVELKSPVVEEISDLQNIELLEHENYVYIKGYPNYPIYVKYLIYSEMNEFYATKVELKSSIKQTQDGISSVVSKKADKREIISTINQSAEEVKIKANKLGLEGYTTINENFKIDLEGNMSCNNANINGDIVTKKGVLTNLHYNSESWGWNQENVYDQQGGGPIGFNLNFEFTSVQKSFLNFAVRIPKGFTVKSAKIYLRHSPIVWISPDGNSSQNGSCKNIRAYVANNLGVVRYGSYYGASSSSGYTPSFDVISNVAPHNFSENQYEEYETEDIGNIFENEGIYNISIMTSDGIPSTPSGNDAYRTLGKNTGNLDGILEIIGYTSNV